MIKYNWSIINNIVHFAGTVYKADKQQLLICDASIVNETNFTATRMTENIPERTD